MYVCIHPQPTVLEHALGPMTKLHPYVHHLSWAKRNPQWTQPIRFVFVVLENLLPAWLLMRTNFFIPSRFLDYLYEHCQLLSALYSDMRKNILYRCTSTFLALNYCSGIFFKSLSYLYEVVRTTFSADLFDFSKFFDRNFATIVAPPSNTNENYVVHLKEQSILKKSAENRIKIDP